jgi:hypothetical protein
MDLVSVDSSLLDECGEFDVSVSGQEDLSTTRRNDSTSASGEIDQIQDTIAAKESGQVAAAKRVAIIVLLVFAGAAAYVTFSFTERGLRENFVSEVSNQRLLFCGNRDQENVSIDLLSWFFLLV